jgi:hypothetical protein
MLEGRMTGILKQAAALIVAANPRERESASLNAGILVPLRIDAGDGIVLTGNLTLTVNGSRYFGLPEAEADQAKKAEKAIAAAKAAGIDLPPSVAQAVKAAQEKAKAAREAKAKAAAK